MPTGQWDPLTSPRPIIFLHGLGMGLVQYHRLLSRMVAEFPDRPILIPLQPHVSHNFFHPDFLNPLNRYQMGERLSGILQEFGWVNLDSGKVDGTSTDELEVTPSQSKSSQRGVTVLSHSK